LAAHGVHGEQAEAMLLEANVLSGHSIHESDSDGPEEYVPGVHAMHFEVSNALTDMPGLHIHFGCPDIAESAGVLSASEQLHSLYVAAPRGKTALYS